MECSPKCADVHDSSRRTSSARKSWPPSVARAVETPRPGPLVPLQDQLTNDLKLALRSGDSVRRDVLRYSLNALQYAAKEQGRDLQDEECLQVLQREAKKRRDSISLFAKGGRQDLVDKETTELDIVEAYLPKQKSREEITAAVQEVIQELNASGPSDRGKVMGSLMPKLRGQADGALVNQIVSDLLSNISNS